VLRAGSDFDAMDLATRNLYRSAIEDLARGSQRTETEIATAALARADTAGDANRRTADPGYYLVARGRREFERSLGYRAPLRDWPRRLDASNVGVVVADGRALPVGLTGFDRALVDAPCSGLGVLNRRPDLRWRAEPLPELQLELLRAAAERVRPGGTIVYSVCTINADESEAVVDASGLDIDPSLADEWPQFRHRRRPEFLQTLPHAHGTAGFFIARLIAR
jgi:hypothetical protein